MKWSFCLLPLASYLAAFAILFAQPPADSASGEWESYEEEGGCIGGSRCGDQGVAIRIPLEDAPVYGVRFHAHDNVGEESGGRLRVRIDAVTVAPEIEVAATGERYEFPLKRLRGRFLIVETHTDDEVVVEHIEVRYGGPRQARQRREWRAYPEEAGCIGGERCRDQGNSIRIPLADARVYSVRFRAHDKVGSRTRGHLRVRIDGRSLARDIDVPRDGESYNLLVEGLRGRNLIFEVLTDEEIVIEDIEVQYAGLRDPWERRRRPR